LDPLRGELVRARRTHLARGSGTSGTSGSDGAGAPRNAGCGIHKKNGHYTRRVAAFFREIRFYADLSCIFRARHAREKQGRLQTDRG